MSATVMSSETQKYWDELPAARKKGQGRKKGQPMRQVTVSLEPEVIRKLEGEVNISLSSAVRLACHKFVEDKK